MKVESLSPRKRRPNVLVLTFENGETLDLHVEVVMRHSVVSGSVIEEEKMEVLLREDEDLRAREAAWRLLSHRPRSRLELVRALRQRKFMKSTAERIAEELEQKGFLNDEAFARQFAEERSRKRHGPRLIEQELRARGIGREEAQGALADYTSQEKQQEDARELLHKWNRRSKPEDPRKRKIAAAQYLVRRGYDQDVVWDAVREVLGENEEF